MDNVEKMLRKVQELHELLARQQQELQALAEEALRAAGIDVEEEVEDWMPIVVEAEQGGEEGVLRFQCLMDACNFELERRLGDLGDEEPPV